MTDEKKTPAPNASVAPMREGAFAMDDAASADDYARAGRAAEEVTATEIAEHNFRNGQVFALKQAVANLRGSWDFAADIVEKLIAEKEAL